MQPGWDGADDLSTEAANYLLHLGIHDPELRLEIRVKSRFVQVNERRIHLKDLVWNGGPNCVGDFLAACNNGCG